MLFEPAVKPLPDSGGPVWRFNFYRDQILVRVEGPEICPQLQDGPESPGLITLSRRYLGLLDGRPCYAAEVAAADPWPAGWDLLGLRQLYGRVDDDLFRLAGRAAQIMAWDRASRYCGACGTLNEEAAGERAKVCPACGLMSFPRISPAVIVAIVKGDQILLARAKRFTHCLFSVIAGFVEPGETLEECLRREVREEVGLEIANIRYFGSQPWPFPDSLMIAYTAEYAGGEIRIDPGEIAEAGWFSADNLPRIPEKLSIARELIDWFVFRRNGSGSNS